MTAETSTRETREKTGECNGSGALPMRHTVRRPSAELPTGECPACQDRYPLAHGVLIPAHQRPTRRGAHSV
jgi:hypothetical protein